MSFKPKIYLTLIFLIFTKITVSQQTSFERFYDFGAAETAYTVLHTNDGGFVIGGRQGISLSNAKNLIYKIDSLGVLQWYRLIELNFGENTIYSSKVTLDSSLIFTGVTSSVNNLLDAFLLKTNLNGDTLWSKTYNEIGNQFGLEVIQTNDSGFAIAVLGDDFGEIIKTNNIGEMLWKKSYLFQNTFSPSIRSIIQTVDSGFLLCGSIQDSSNNYSVILIKTNILGDTIWTRKYKNYNANINLGYSVDQTNDGGYVIGGITQDSLSPFYNCFIIKTDSLGNEIWNASIGNQTDFIDETLSKIIQTPDGGLVFSGTYSSQNNDDLYLVKLAQNGLIEWEKHFGGFDNESGFGLDLSSDGGYASCGYTNSFCLGCAYIVKTDQNGLVNSISMQNNSNLKIVTYPNPANEILYINLDYFIKKGEVKINDISVKNIISTKFDSYELVIEVGNLSDGMYFIQIFDNNNQIFHTQKLIIKH